MELMLEQKIKKVEQLELDLKQKNNDFDVNLNMVNIILQSNKQVLDAIKITSQIQFEQNKKYFESFMKFYTTNFSRQNRTYGFDTEIFNMYDENIKFLEKYEKIYEHFNVYGDSDFFQKKKEKFNNKKSK